MFDLESSFVNNIGPLVFRVAWWHFLDPSKRPDFPQDMFEVITTSVLQTFRDKTGIVVPAEAKPKFASMLKDRLESHTNQMLSQLMPKYLEGTYEKFVHNAVNSRSNSTFHEQIAQQYDYFCGRISKLTPELVTSVKLINEEFLIWLKTHPSHSEKIHADAFEQLTGEILTSHGFEVEFTGRIKNKSADLLAIKGNHAGSETKYLVECKRYGTSKPVGIAILNAVVGASFRAKICHAMLVTTSSFTSNVLRSECGVGRLPT